MELGRVRRLTFQAVFELPHRGLLNLESFFHLPQFLLLNFEERIQATGLRSAFVI